MNLSDGLSLRVLGTSLHQRILEGDVTASAEIAETFLPLIVSYLQQQNANLYDPHLVYMAADDALISYLQRPSQYDPTRLPLDRYLFMSARGDLNNLRRKERNLGLPENVQLVELDASEREYKTDVEDVSLSVEEQAAILTSPVWSLLERLLPKITDREIVLLMLEGIRDTDEYARTLGLSHLPKADQAAEVKRHKDRIKKTLQRHIDRSKLDATK